MHIVNNIIKLSFCIPTNGRGEVLKNTLNSFYNSTIYSNEIEIVIYDSSDDNNVFDSVKEFLDFSNLVYIKGPNDSFLNLINALRYGKGLFLKLHNDYTMFNKESANEILNIIDKKTNNKPVIFFSNGVLNNAKKIHEFKSFNDFIYASSFYNSWSTSFGIWKSDFESLNNIFINPLFPHNSFLFSLSHKDIFLIDDTKYFQNQNVKNKGGYDLFHTFSVIYIQMIEDLYTNKKIKRETFNHIKKDLFNNFLIQWYCNTMIFKNDYNYQLSNIKYSITVYYSVFEYYILLFKAYLKGIVYYFKLFYKSIFNYFKFFF
jgi:abequosyltransferase